MKSDFNSKAAKGIRAAIEGTRLFPWFLIPGAWLLLSGCSTTSETFDCSPGKGVGCKSISEVNHMVDQGVLGEGALGKGGNNVTTILPPELVIAMGSLEDKLTGIQGAGLRLVDGGHARRVPEEHLRVWVAPFQDDQGNLHEGSVIHTVLKPGHWQLQAGE